MINVLSVENVRESERKAISCGASEDELIERAAGKLCGVVCERADGNSKILVLYGGGNNGADGLSCAALLKRGGKIVEICSVSDRKNGRVTEREKICEKLGIPKISLENSFETFGVIVDAMLGIGLDRELCGNVKLAAEKINESAAYVISADVPTGLCADSGTVFGACVKADETVTFSCVKTGLLTGEAKRYVGRLTVADIGIATASDMRLFEESDIKIKPRDPAGHKYDYGKVAIIGGSPKMVGAPLMAFESSVAALKSGAGLSVLCIPENTAAAYVCRVKESMLDFIRADNDGIVFDAESLDRIMRKTDCIAVGMGMPPNGELRKTIKYLCENFGGALILDAGALGALSGYADIIDGAKCRVVLTPHRGEFERLCGGDEKDFLSRVIKFSREHNCVTVCKGAVSIVSDGKQTLFCDFGTPSLSKGGSGDVLSGIICALAARYDTIAACAYGCYFLGQAAKRVESRLSPDSVIASDVISEITIKQP